jgi:hypothetical protein
MEKETGSPMKLHFSIRDLLWLTAVAALAIGWSVDRISIQRDRTALVRDKDELEQQYTSFAEMIEKWNELRSSREYGGGPEFKVKPRLKTHANIIDLLPPIARDIYDGKIAPDANGICKIDPSLYVCEDAAYVTKHSDGSTLILFRTAEGKGSNLRGYIFTDGPPLTVGAEVEVLTFVPLGPAGGVPAGKAGVIVDRVINPKCYAVSRSSD